MLAQEVQGFAAAGAQTNSFGETFPVFTAGATVDLGRRWISAGGQGDLFVSWPYFAGRGTVFGQLRPFPRRRVSPIVLGGVGFGEVSGPMLGAGLEVSSGQRPFEAEDYRRRLRFAPTHVFELRLSRRRAARTAAPKRCDIRSPFVLAFSSV